MYNNKTFECFMVLGFGCGCFQELGWKVASKLYLTSMLSLPTILILSLFLSFFFSSSLDSCLDGRRGCWLFGDDSHLFTHSTVCLQQRCWHMPIASLIGNADTVLARLLQAQKPRALWPRSTYCQYFSTVCVHSYLQSGNHAKRGV